MTTRETNFWLYVAKHMPVKLVYFCFIEVMAHSTTGKYGNTIVPKLSGVDALKRYGDDKKI